MLNRTPLFLAKSGYRSRRMTDAARLLPVVGAFLLGLPAIWALPAGGAYSTATVGVYIFVVWAGLIAAAAVLARHVPKGDPGPPPPRDQI